jgi:hypothetical protein
MVVLVDDENLANDINLNVRDKDIVTSIRINAGDLNYSTNNRNPATIALELAREL